PRSDRRADGAGARPRSRRCAVRPRPAPPRRRGHAERDRGPPRRRRQRAPAQDVRRVAARGADRRGDARPGAATGIRPRERPPDDGPSLDLGGTKAGLNRPILWPLVPVQLAASSTHKERRMRHAFLAALALAAWAAPAARADLKTHPLVSNGMVLQRGG